jgi:NitT/TauT family transport system substrate-binding protein
MVRIWARRALLGMVLAVLFAGGLTGVAAAAQTKDLGKLRVGVLPVGDCLQIFVADAKGYLKEEGFSAVELSRMAGGAAVAPAVEGGSLDLGWSNVVSVALAHEQGFDHVFITPGASEMEGHRVHKIMVAADAPVRRAADLEGKAVAVNTLANIPFVAAAAWLRANGVQPDKVQFVEVPFPNMEAALKSKQVAAAVMLEPFVTASQAAGSTRALENEPFKAFGPRSLIASWFAKKSWLAANPDKAAAFRRAIAKATRAIRANPAEARLTLLTYTRLSKDLAEKIVMPAFEESLPEADVQAVLDATARQGLLKATFPAKDILILQ